MTDPTQFMIEHSILHRILTHEGLLGKGRDFLTGKPCSLHYYADKYKRNFVMQLFEGVDSDFLSNKLNRMAKAGHSNFVSNIIRPSMFSTRKTSKGFFDFSIFYDVTGIYGMSLESVIGLRVKNKQKFSEEQITGFFWQMCDMIKLCGKYTHEYLELTPMNIFCKMQTVNGFNFFPNNFGLHFTGTTWQKKYHNVSDQFWKGKRTSEAALRTTMFTLGMVLLQMCSLLTPQQLFENGIINEKALNKRIEGIKIINDQLICKVIQELLKINEFERITIDQIYQNKQWLKTRKVLFEQGQANSINNFKNFTGVISDQKDFALGEGLDQNMCLIRGTFQKGILEGFAAKQNKNNTLEAGLFSNNQLKQGQRIIKNKYILIGNFKNDDDIVSGFRIALNIGLINTQNNKQVAFIGQFSDNEPIKGTKYFQDGTSVNI